MNNLNELYGSMRKLERELRVAGHERLANRLEFALNGTTSGEILEGLWFALREVQSVSLGGGLVMDAPNFIKKILGPPKSPRA